jgi:glycosyltransferase involved in cell wall biosynthesis
VFNRQLVTALGRQADVRVIAPVLWAPWRRMPPKQEMLDNVPLLHPRVFYTPGLWVRHHWRMYRKSVRSVFGRSVKDFAPDHVIVSYAYPDGVAMGPLCRDLGVPYSIRIHGSDFRLRAFQPGFRDLVLETLRETPLVLAHGKALKADMAAEGIDESTIVSFINGVDSALFKFRTKQDALHELEARDALPSQFQISNFEFHERKLALFVGNLVPVKGPDILLSAFAELVNRYSLMVNGGNPERKSDGNSTDHRIDESTNQSLLLLLGDGPFRKQLQRQARNLGMAEHVRFLGQRSHDEIALWMNAADCLCLPSRSEGVPNVVLEALTSGLPVVAAGVGEVPRLLADENGGRVIPGEERSEFPPSPRLRRASSVQSSGNERRARRFAGAIRELTGGSIDRPALAERHRNRYSWDTAATTIITAIQAKSQKPQLTNNE